MGRKIGIWLDNKSALFIVILDEDVKSLRIHSGVEDFHPKGGSGTATPWGPQDARGDGKLTERKRHQLHQYYSELIGRLKPDDQIYIFGPAEAKIGLKKEIEKYPAIAKNLLAVETADSMTENQMKARVREFFENLVV